MLVLPSYDVPLLVESVNDPLTVDRHWVFSAKAMDFFLSHIIYVEEYIGPVMLLEIKNFVFSVPANWYIMICDRDTTFVDVVPVSGILGKEFDAFIFTNTDAKPRYLTVKVNDLIPEQRVVYPVIQKGHGMVHPIGKDHQSNAILSCVIGPHDMFQKINTNVTMGDILYA